MSEKKEQCKHELFEHCSLKLFITGAHFSCSQIK